MTIRESTGPGHATTILTIDLDALAANYRLLSNRAAPARCAAVVKADGYGLGVEPVAQTLVAAGCSTFFVAHLDEGVALRMILKDQEADIFVMNGLMPGTESAYRVYRLFPVLNDLGQIERWGRNCGEYGEHPAAVHVDTGMSRLGLPPQELKTLIAEPQRLDGFELRCIMSHLACADTPSHPLNRQQQSDFAAAIAQLPQATASLSASSGIFLGADWHFDMVRPGVSLYGSAPVPGEDNPMAPVISLTGKILQIREVDAPQTVGYGAAHRFTAPTRVATVAAGYADGYLRSISSRGVAYVGDTAVPVIGRVSMDLITLDISSVPAAQPGDDVELIGPHHDVDALAAEAGTIGYEMLTSLGRRYRRRYTGGPA
jgi:alanine racemase